MAGRRDQRNVSPLPSTATRPTGTANPWVPGDRDIVQQPGFAMEDNASARVAGEAVATQWGGAPKNSSPQVGNRKG